MSNRDRRLAEMMGVYQKGQTIRQYFYHDSGGNKLWSSWPTDEDEFGSLLTVREVIPDFSLPKWRARLMDWAVEQEWYWDFEEWITNEKFPDTPEGIMFTQYLWRNLATLVVEYHGEGRE